uniref:Annexin n=1 Tax=Myripristis murdjan TaxID=586833 RepID=A0A667XSW4_9TELE
MTLFRKFLDNVVHDRHPDEGTIIVVGKPKSKYYGTVTPYPNFCARSDAAALEKAIETKGVDEDVIISILVDRSNEQRQKIKAAYEESTGKPLADALKSALRSHLEDVALALLMTPAQFDAHELRKATKGFGTKEAVLVEILASRSNQEIRDIKRVFKEEYEEELEDVIKSDTSGDFTSALLAMLKADKDEDNTIDLERAKKDAVALFEAGENSKGTDVSTFINILTSRSGPQLTKSELSRLGRYITRGLNTPNTHLQRKHAQTNQTVKCAWSKPAFFAEKLHLAMKGRGTCEDTLTRVLVSRSEVDLKKVMDEFKAMYGKTLQEVISDDVKGHFEKILLALCGPH